MKKLVSIILVLCFMLTGCKRVQDTIDQETTSDKVIANSFDNTYYNTINSKGDSVREVIYNDLSSNQNDFNIIGRGLQLISLNTFSNKDHYLREATHLVSEDYNELFGRGEYSIQPPKGEIIDGIEDPVLFESIIQQEFVKKSSDSSQPYSLAGLSIALAIAPDAKVNGVAKEFTAATIDEYSRRAIDIAYRYFSTKYEDLKEVPILVSVYQLAKSTDTMSGKYIYSSVCQNGVTGDIKNVNMESVVFTSEKAKTLDNALSSEFVLFKEKMKTAAMDATGVIGYGTYFNNEIVNMRIEIKLNTKTYTETIALMNLAASEMDICFTSNFDMTVIVYSQNQLQGFIIKKAGQKAISNTIY